MIISVMKSYFNLSQTVQIDETVADSGSGSFGWNHAYLVMGSAFLHFERSIFFQKPSFDRWLAQINRCYIY